MLGGKAAQSGGWLSRSQRLIDEQPGECAEQGLLLVICGLRALFEGDGKKACLQFEQAALLGRRFADADLLAVSLLGQGQAQLQLQRTDEGVALLDESMIAVTSGQVTPITAGIIYCAVILACEGICDLQRAQEWTVALDKWCGAQPGLVAFRGQCLVHRSEVLRFKGDWAAALAAASQAREFLAGRSERLLGRAIYQEAELHRLAGHLVRAEEAYREAGSKGFEPQPGISLLLLEQGEAKAAAASIRRVASEVGKLQGPGAGVQRVRVLGPYVEIMLAVDELEPARAAVAELERTAARMKAPFLAAIAAHEKGSVLLADGQPETALTALREAWTLWQQLEVPFESARARVLIAQACEQLGDEVTAKLHLDAAASIFERLGAAPQTAALRAGAAARDGPAAALSVRERQVLALLAAGLVAAACLRPGDRVLDAACGTGIVTRLAARQLNKSGSVAGLDVNPGMIAVARAATPRDLTIDWYETGAEAIPLADGSFDVVLCQMGLQFFSDKTQALKEMHRVLAPGSRMLLNVPGPTPPLFAALGEAAARHIDPQCAAFVDVVFSLHGAEQTRALLDSAGFQDIDVTRAHKALRLPPPEDFLWQYVHSTPLAAVFGKASEAQRAALSAEQR